MFVVRTIRMRFQKLKEKNCTKLCLTILKRTEYTWSQTKSKIIVWAFLPFRYVLPSNATSYNEERSYTERYDCACIVWELPNNHFYVRWVDFFSFFFFQTHKYMCAILPLLVWIHAQPNCERTRIYFHSHFYVTTPQYTRTQSVMVICVKWRETADCLRELNVTVFTQLCMHVWRLSANEWK